MLEHNKHHAAELDELREALIKADKSGPANKLADAIMHYDNGNRELEAVIALLG